MSVFILPLSQAETQSDGKVTSMHSLYRH